MSKSHQESNTVYHYTRIIDKKYLLEEYYTIVEKIFNNQISSGMELLQYPGYNVFSARVNNKIRIIFGEQNNKLHVVCVLTDHKYEKVLKGKWLKTYLKKEFNTQEVDLPKDAILKAEDFLPCKTPPVFKSTPGKIHFKALDLCKSRTITYDETQESVIEADFPLTVSGVSGAGKTVTLIAKLTRAASRLKSGKLLVITSSKTLVEETHKEYLRFAESNPNIQVDIKTMEEVIKQHAPETQGLPFVGEENFQLWFTNVYLKTAGKLNIKPELLKNLDLIYDECKLVVGLRAEDLDIGLRYRQFKTPEEINWLKQLSIKYTKYLESTKQVNPAFFTRPLKTCYDVVLADESHKLSPRELSIAIKLAKDQRVGFCFDTNQKMERNLLFEKTVRKRIQLQAQTKKEITSIILTRCYRCALPICEVGNAVLAIKNALFISTDKSEQKKMVPTDTGAPVISVVFAKHQQELDLANLNQSAKNSGFVVLGSNENAIAWKAKARHLFPKATLNTFEESAGHEFKMALLFNAFNGADFRKINGLYLESQREGIPFQKTLNEYFSSLLNGLFTGITRCQEVLIIYQEQIQGIEALLEKILENKAAGAVEVPVLAESSPKDWFKMASKYEKNNQSEQAQEILKTHGWVIEKPVETTVESKKEAETLPITAQLPQLLPSQKGKANKHRGQNRTRSPVPLVPVQAKTQIAKTQEKSVKSVLTPQQAYVEGFVLNTSEARLEKLFNHPALNDYLFEVSTSNNANLFTILVENLSLNLFFLNNPNRKALINKIDPIKLSAHFNGEKKMNFMKTLTLVNLIEHHDALITKLNFNELKACMPLLSMGDEGINLVAKIDPLSITKELLIDPCAFKTEVGMVDICLFFNLAKSEKGRALLLNIFTVNKELIGSMNANVLLKIWVDTTTALQSSIYAECYKSDKGKEFLDLLINNNAALHSDPICNPDHFIKIMTANDSDEKTKFPVFAYTAQCIDGRKIIYNYLKKNEVPKELVVKLFNIFGIFFLTQEEYGLKMLRYIAKSAPDTFSTIDIKGINKDWPLALNTLCLTPEYIEILIKICRNNRKLVNALTLPMFIDFHVYETDVYLFKSKEPINNAMKLGSYPTGRMLLETLIEFNPALNPAMVYTLDCVNRCWIDNFEAYLVTDNADTAKNIMQFVMMSTQNLLAQPLREKIFNEYFTTRFPKNHSPTLFNCNYSAKKTVKKIFEIFTTPFENHHGTTHLIALILENVAQIRILEMLFEFFPMLYAEFRLKHLEFTWTLPGNQGLCSMIDALVESQKGLMFFYKLLINNPQLTKALPERLFTRCYNKAPKESAINIGEKMFETYLSFEPIARNDVNIISYLDDNCPGFHKASQRYQRQQTIGGVFV